MLADADRQRACFAAVARVLAAGGAFVVEAFVPWDPPRGGSHVEVRSMTADRVVLAADITDPAAQIGPRAVRRAGRRPARALAPVRPALVASGRARRLGGGRRAAARRALRRRRARSVHRRFAVPRQRLSAPSGERNLSCAACLPTLRDLDAPFRYHCSRILIVSCETDATEPAQRPLGHHRLRSRPSTARLRAAPAGHRGDPDRPCPFCPGNEDATLPALDSVEPAARGRCA